MNDSIAVPQLTSIDVVYGVLQSYAEGIWMMF